MSCVICGRMLKQIVNEFATAPAPPNGTDDFADERDEPFPSKTLAALID